MAKHWERVRHFSRSVNFLRQQIGWQELWKRVNTTGLAPIVVDPAVKHKQETILVLAPHPDDEVFGCGGALCYHQSLGDSITVLYLCSGNGGDPKKTKNRKLASLRRAEALDGLALVSATAQFWDQPDGHLRPTTKLTAQLTAELERIKPDRIYTPWLFDNHPDHIATTALLLAALASWPFNGEIWQYEVWSPLVPNRFLPIGSFIERKTELINCHQSQLKHRQYRSGILGLNNYRGLQADLNEPVEGYFALSFQEFVKFAGDKS